MQSTVWVGGFLPSFICSKMAWQDFHLDNLPFALLHPFSKLTASKAVYLWLSNLKQPLYAFNSTSWSFLLNLLLLCSSVSAPPPSCFLHFPADWLSSPQPQSWMNVLSWVWRLFRDIFPPLPLTSSPPTHSVELRQSHRRIISSEDYFSTKSGGETKREKNETIGDKAKLGSF